MLILQELQQSVQVHDYIVVGKGIAGSILAYRLSKEGKSIAIIDEDSGQASWKVAGGIWNALSFKRILKGWMADETTDEAHIFYKKAQEDLGIHFYEERKIVRIFGDVHFQNTWYSKSGETKYSDFLSDDYPKELDSMPIKMPFGAGTVKKGGFVRLTDFIPAMKNYLSKRATLINEKLDFDFLEINEDSVKYKEISAEKIIFCEGYEVVNNPFFSWLPLKLTKGETLTIKNPGWSFDSIINNGKHLIDHYDGYMSVGATFEWKELNHEITVKGRNELLNHLEKNFEFNDWEVVNQKAGIRPTVSDRRPLGGVHPNYNNVFIFNGLGTKGVLIAPWFSKKMTGFLIHGEELPEEGNIQRFIKKHFR